MQWHSLIAALLHSASHEIVILPTIQDEPGLRCAMVRVTALVYFWRTLTAAVGYREGFSLPEYIHTYIHTEHYVLWWCREWRTGLIVLPYIALNLAKEERNERRGIGMLLLLFEACLPEPPRVMIFDSPLHWDRRGQRIRDHSHKKHTHRNRPEYRRVGVLQGVPLPEYEDFFFRPSASACVSICLCLTCARYSSSPRYLPSSSSSST